MLVSLVIIFSVRLATAAEDIASETESIGPVTIFNTEQFPLESAINGQKYILQVQYPLGYEFTDQNYPVVYLLDPEMLFRGFVDDHNIMSQAMISPFHIIVGIAYDLRDLPLQAKPLRFAGLRMRDLTPTVDEEFMITQQAWVDQLGSFSDSAGGAEQFLRVINEEVKPFVNSHYRTDEENETLFITSFN